MPEKRSGTYLLALQVLASWLEGVAYVKSLTRSSRAKGSGLGQRVADPRGSSGQFFDVIQEVNGKTQKMLKMKSAPTK